MELGRKELDEDLKTLKDITYRTKGISVSDLEDEDGFYRQIVERHLRQEAIKWVKELRKPNTPRTYGVVNRYSQIIWIIKFFDLSEDDLK